MHAARPDAARFTAKYELLKAQINQVLHHYEQDAARSNEYLRTALELYRKHEA